METLADRYRWVGLEKDLERLRFHLAKLPRHDQHFGLAFIAAHEDDYAGAIAHVLKYIDTLLSAQKAPPGVDFAWQLYLAEAFSADNAFWLAAVRAGQVSAWNTNVHGATSWHRQALRIDAARAYPDVWFEAALCFGKTKRHDEEVNAYQQCLQCYPKFPSAKNNLGWALLKAGRLKEAEQVLCVAIKLEAERPYAAWNLARTLTKLGRLKDAVVALQQDVTENGTIRRSAAKEIARLEQIIEEKGPSGGTPQGHDIDDEEGCAEGPRPRSAGSSDSKHNKPTPTEKILEALIEQKILQGDEVFKRGLRMYGGDDQLYGRQYPVPGIGVIDLLAEDTKTGDLVVIELKRGRATREIIAQIEKYVGWVRENLAKPEQKVIPIICLHTADHRLKSAAEAAGIEVFEYDLSFRKVSGK